MVSEVVMPLAGQITKDLRIVRWCKKVGEWVRKGEPLLEVETDKAVMERELSGWSTPCHPSWRRGSRARWRSYRLYRWEDELPPKVTEEERESREVARPEKPRAQAVVRRKGGILASPLARRIARDYNITVEEMPRSSPRM